MTEYPIRVLLVDDEESLRKPLTDYLRNVHTFMINAVADGESALYLLKHAQGRYDIVLIDQVLAEGPSGLDILREIKANYSDIEVILFTGWEMNAGIEALRAGAYRYLAKPFDKSELAMTIRFAAEQKRIRKEHNYTEALVSTTRALTQTIARDEQLSIIWDFVRDKLAMPTCFLAVYDAKDATLKFPLSYDKGELSPLPDRTLGDDSSNWGLAGLVVKTGGEQVWFTREQGAQVRQSLGINSHVHQNCSSKSGICLALRTTDEILGALAIQSYEPYAFDEALLNTVRALGNQISVTLQNSRLVNEAKLKALNLDKLQNVTLAINSKLDLKDVLTQTCQAVVELSGVDHSGIVLFDPDLKTGKVFAEYPSTEKALGRIIPLEGIPAEEDLVFRHEVINVPDVENSLSLGSVREIFEDLDIKSTLLVPIIFNNQPLGSFSLDAMQKPRAFSSDEIEICQRLAHQVAVAIENTRLIVKEQEATHRLQKQADRLRVLYEIGKEITSTRQVEPILNSIAKNVIRLIGARRSLFLLVDSKGRRVIKATGEGYPEEHLHSISIDEVEAGVSGSVLQTQQAVLIENAQNDPRNTGKALDKAKEFATVPLIVAPIVIKGQAIGTLTAVNSVGDPPFDEDDKDLVVMLAAQAAIAYDNARQMRELEQLQRAAEAMAREAEWKAVLQEISRRAKQLLEADFTLIWPYDAERRIFFPEDLVAENVPHDSLEQFRKIEPEAGKTTEQVLKKGYVKVENLSAERPNFLGESTRSFLDALDVQSFMGITLMVADEPLGVLYVDYKHVRSFGDDDRRILEHFANHAALTLKRARLLRMVNRARETARIVAEVTTLGNLKDTLKEIVQGAKHVLGCDIVTLYTFDQRAHRFQHVEGVGYSDKRNLRLPENVAPDSSLWRIINLEEPYYHPAENVSKDSLLQGAFVRAEKIHSALGIQLRFEGERVGLMFINYNAAHRFTQDEINDALQFANQAAVAIRNAKWHDEAIRHTEIMNGLYEAGQTITRSFSLDETLTRITEQALHVVGMSSNGEGFFSHIALREGNKLRFVAAQPQAMIKQLQNIDLETGSRKGVAGRAVITGQTKNIGDVSQDLDYISINPATKSQLSVVLKTSNNIIGVLSIESPDLDAFTSDDENNVGSLAAQAAIAIENARHVDQIESMRFAAESLVGATNVEMTLQQIVVLSKSIMRSNSTAVWSYDDLRDRFPEGELVHEGVSLEAGEAFRTNPPQHGGIGYSILENRLVEVEDVRDASYSFLTPQVQDLLLSLEIGSFVGVALIVGTEKLGVLYINYDSPRHFTDDDRDSLRAFANQAALALKNAKFLEQQARLRNAFRVIAELTILGDLPKTLESIATGAKAVFGCDTVILYTYYEDRKQFGLSPTMVGALFPDKVLGIGEVLEDSVVTRILDKDSLYRTEDAQNDPILGGEFAKREGIKSSVGIPLVADGRKVGVMFISFRSAYRFTEEVLTDTRLFADQAAIAIRNAQLHAETQERAQALAGLYEAGKAITSTMTLTDTLKQIAAQALRIVPMASHYEQCFSHLALLEQNRLDFVVAHPPKMLELLQGDTQTDLTASRKIGISGRATKTSQSQVVSDVLQDPDYVSISSHTRSQLSVPLKIKNHVIGVLSVEHPLMSAFSEDDRNNVELLAAQAAVAIRNAQTHGKITQELAARTALAWTGMVSSTWRHAIEKHAVTIREQIELVRRDLIDPTKNYSIERRLNMIERLANQILKKPLTAPLTEEEGVEVIQINDFIRTRGEQLWAHLPYRQVIRDLSLTLDSSVMVRVSIEWLRRAFDIVIDNAVNALSGIPESKIRIATRAVNRMVEIHIEDNGPGIPSDVQTRLFREPILKQEDATGLGMGLMFAQMIIQTYGGDIQIGRTGRDGTIMIISLPAEF